MRIDLNQASIVSVEIYFILSPSITLCQILTYIWHKQTITKSLYLRYIIILFQIQILNINNISEEVSSRLRGANLRLKFKGLRLAVADGLFSLSSSERLISPRRSKPRDSIATHRLPI